MENTRDKCRLRIRKNFEEVRGRNLEDLIKFENPNEADIHVITSQIKRKPSGEIFILARCPHGMPAVFLTIPEDLTGGPIPPPLWLSCPFASRVIAGLESDGYVSVFSSKLGDKALREKFSGEEIEYASFLRSLLSKHASKRVRFAFDGKGVSGGKIGSIKCLHAHTAYALSTGCERGMIGRWCIEKVGGEENLWCAGKDEACFN